MRFIFKHSQLDMIVCLSLLSTWETNRKITSSRTAWNYMMPVSREKMNFFEELLFGLTSHLCQNDNNDP